MPLTSEIESLVIRLDNRERMNYLFHGDPTIEADYDLRSAARFLRQVTWQPIKNYDGPDRERVDIWLHIYASPKSIGMSDSFRVIEAFRIDGKWFHNVESGAVKELDADYITHWMECPAPPETR